MPKSKSVATPIDERPICSVCKSNKADIVEENTFYCAHCMLKLPRYDAISKKTKKS